MNVEKVVVVPEGDVNDLQNDEIDFNEYTENNRTENQLNSDISKDCFPFWQISIDSKNNCAPSSEARKYVYSVMPESREIFSKHGKLKGLVKICPYLME